MTGALLGGRYRLGRSLGSGATGEVFGAYDETLSRPVAVKVVHEHLAADERVRVRLGWEAADAARLSHPNVVAVLGYGEEAGRPYIVMEMLEGSTLAEVLGREGRLDVSRAVGIARAALAGLGAVHADGLVHLDVKPANLMLTDDGVLKVLDVGIASAGWAGASGETSANAMLSRVSTAAYLSPEQVRGVAVDRRSDLYSVGCCLYEMLTGRPPFGETTPFVVARRHLVETPRPPSAYAPDVPSRVEAVVARAMSREPERRFTTASEMERALRVGLPAASGPPAVEAPAEPLPLDATAGARADGRREPDAGEPDAAAAPADPVRWMRLGLASALVAGLALATALAR
jgi:serine/threonine protein kinase